MPTPVSRVSGTPPNSNVTLKLPGVKMVRRTSYTPEPMYLWRASTDESLWVQDEGKTTTWIRDGVDGMIYSMDAE